MTDKSTTSSVIALPKGGGALSGLGEKFSPDLHTGTGNFSVPIGVPAGRNGFQPQLTLGYSTGQGQGLFGLGWALGVPGVSRKTSKGIPRYRDADPLGASADVFVLSGAEDLVALGSSDRVQYRPRTEGLFAEITRRVTPGQPGDHWRVRTKDGLVSYYGTSPDDRPTYPPDLEVSGGDPAVTARPDAPDRVFAWNLTLTVDPFGNRIEYLYRRSRSGPQDEASGHRWDVPVLAQIRYADRGAAGARSFLVTVDFDYEPRPDPFSDYRAGFEVRHGLRCRSIRTRTHLTQALDVREYRFVYREDDKTRASLLAAVEVYGFDDTGGAVLSMPPLELGYTTFVPETSARRDFFPVAGKSLPVSSLADPTLELVDLHGQGLPDILELGVTARYWQNLGGGRFDEPRPLRSAPDGLPLGSPGVQLLDADGDGRMDLMVTRDALTGYFPLRFGPAWDARSFHRYDAAPSFDLRDPDVRLIDLTGDGVTDAIRSSRRLDCYFNDPEHGFTGSRSVERGAQAVFPDVMFSDPRVLTADMSGDGLTDIVLVHNGSVCYWPNIGYGDFGRQIHMRNAPRLPLGHDPRRLLVGDVNGDGLADLVYIDDRRVHLWLNQSGNGWSDPIVIEGTPPVMHGEALRLVDILGSGIPGVLWTSDQEQSGRDHWFFLDLTGGAKPYLLHSMRNNLGASTRIEYQPSSRFYLDDRRRGGTPWKTTLPFPVQTVARVEVEDALSGARVVTQYTYHHGYWDGLEREFRGFGRVEQLDAERFAQPGSTGETQHSPPVLSKSWFDQGPIEDGERQFRPLDCAAEYWAGDGAELGQAELTASLLLELDRASASLTSAERRRLRRDAMRSLRGSLVRGELYALDGSEREHRPYAVNEALFGFEQKAAPGPERPQRARVFFPHALAQRTTQWERGDDPLTRLSFMHRYDELGQLLSRTDIACPRGWRGRNDRPTAPYLATRATTTYARPDPDGPYIHDRVARTDGFELANTEGMTIAEVAELEDGDASLVRIGQALSFFDGPAFAGLELGKVGRYGALTRSEALVLTPERLAAVHGAQVPAYLQAGPVAWPAEYPVGAAGVITFRSAMPALAGYVHHDGRDPALPGVVEGLFSIGERLEHDFQATPVVPGAERGLVLRRRDAMGHDAKLTYAFDLLPVTVTDAAGLIIRAEYEERFFQPSSVTDPNGNQQRFDLRPDGLLSAAWVRGKAADEGDWARASVQYRYDLFAYQERQQPVSVSTLRYEHHDGDSAWNAVLLGSLLETREYSDGLGRVLQSRSHAEAVRFGDATFGHGVLPEDQTAPSLAASTGTAEQSGQPHVTVSGWQIHDNKGRVVQSYEPFFSEGWDYRAPEEAQKGVSLRMFRDPRGQVIRTLHPDGSEERVVHGVPGSMAEPDLGDPERFEPTPWEAYSYDANDNAGRTHAATTLAYSHCRDTPSSVEIDALGRTIRSVERNRDHAPSPAGAAVPAASEHPTRFRYDLQGNVTEIVDALNRVAFTHAYDLAKHALYTRSLDAGELRLVLDAAGREIERRDSKGAMALQRYDALGRSTHLWARDGAGEAVTLRASTLHGDALPATAAAADRNLLGRPYVHRDGAGTLTFQSYDFKGNPLELTREVIADSVIAAQMSGSPAGGKVVVDWDADPALEGNYTTSHAYDALGRVTRTWLPRDEDGGRKELVPTYNRAGAIEALSLAGDVYIRRIAYNAKGQRVLVAYGNGYLTRHAYNATTLRLSRLRTERYRLAPGAPGDAPSYEPLGGTLQDFGYAYDLAGNILAIRDRAPGSGIQGTPAGDDALDRVFEYDALSRLTFASGRESKGQAAWPGAQANPSASPLDRSTLADGTAFGSPGNITAPGLAPQQTAAYQEAYSYDPAGNLVELWHKSGTRAPWTRQLGMGGLSPSAWRQTIAQHAQGASPWLDPPSNRLTHVGDNAPSSPETHVFDDSGNLLRETGTRHFSWNHANQLTGFSVRSGAAAPASVEACYLYDAAGQRVKKWVRKAGKVETSVYVGAAFERHADGNTANNTLHVLDGESRVALRRVGAAFSDEGAPEIAVKYHFGDHLGSSHVVMGVRPGDGSVLVNREEFYPYGETSYGGFGRKRYRYTGMERDEESGVAYHAARYCAPWLARWLTADPIGSKEGTNVYAYCKSNPLTRIDPGGRADEAPAESSAHDDSSEVVTMCHVAKDAAFELKKYLGPRDLAGNLLEDPYYLWSGDVGKADAEAAIKAAGKGWLMSVTPEHADAVKKFESALAREADKISPGVKFTRDELFEMSRKGTIKLSQGEFRSIWDPPSAWVAGKATAAELPVGRYGQVPGSVQMRIEGPLVTAGALCSGGLRVAGGALTIYVGYHDTEESGNPLWLIGNMIAGTVEATGGIMYAAAAYGASVSGMEIAIAVARFGGGLGMFLGFVHGYTVAMKWFAGEGDRLMGELDAEYRRYVMSLGGIQ
jgi:RHS repeat-associated protein